MRRVLAYVDHVLFDLKQMDPERHKQCTGVSNNFILDNARRINRDLGIPMLARIPVIPGYNNSVANIQATAKFVAELDPSIKVYLLPYHRMGETKYERLETSPAVTSIEPPTDEYMEELKRIVESFGLQAQIGG